MGVMSDLPRLLKVAEREERKEFVRSFVEGITIHPDEPRIEARVRRLPTFGKKDSTCELVAGVRYEPLQMILEPPDQFIVGRGDARAVA